MIVAPPLPPLWHSLFIWSITGAIIVSYSLNVSPLWVIFPFKKKKKADVSVPQRSLPSALRLFLLSLEILQLPSQLRSWFRGLFAQSHHILSVSWCMSEQHIKRTLSRSDWNWNHFIMRHYGKCCASEGAINIVKCEPNAVSIQRLHVLFLGPGFIVDLFLFAVLFKC